MNQLPAGWVQSTVGAVLPVLYGKAASRADGGHVPVVASAGPIRHTTQELAHGPTLVVGRKGGVGRVQLFDEPIWPTDTTYFISVPEALSAKFLYHQMSSLGLERLDRSTAVPSLQRQDLESASIVLPPRPEQDRIVAAIEEQFSRIDAGVAALDRIRQNLSRMRAGVLTAAVTGTLTASGEMRVSPGTSSGDRPLIASLTADNARKVARTSADLRMKIWRVPSRWEWRTAAELCEVVASGSTPAPHLMHPGLGDVPYIKVYNLTHHGALDFSVRPTFIDNATHAGILSRSRLLPGDTLINIVGPPLGKVSVVPADYPEWNTNQAVVVFRPIASLHPRLLKYWLLSPPVIALLESTSRATAGQFNVSLTTCRSLPLPLPPRDEQDAIVDKLEEYLSDIDSQEITMAATIAQANSLRASILAAAFSGRLVSQDSNDESASELLQQIAVERASSNSQPGRIRKPRTRVTA